VERLGRRKVLDNLKGIGFRIGKGRRTGTWHTTGTETSPLHAYFPQPIFFMHGYPFLWLKITLLYCSGHSNFYLYLYSTRPCFPALQAISRSIVYVVWWLSLECAIHENCHFAFLSFYLVPHISTNYFIILILGLRPITYQAKAFVIVQNIKLLWIALSK
jgi:hypothetical protein